MELCGVYSRVERHGYKAPDLSRLERKLRVPDFMTSLVGDNEQDVIIISMAFLWAVWPGVVYICSFVVAQSS